MKKLIIILALAGLAYGQSFSLSEYAHGVDKEFYWVINSVDSGSTSGGVIYLNQFDSALETYPLGYELEFDTLTAGDEIIAVYIEGKSTNGQWSIVDTVFASDTLNANLSSFNPDGVLDLNASTQVLPMYRPKIVISSASGNPCKVELSIYAYKRD